MKLIKNVSAALLFGIASYVSAKETTKKEIIDSYQNVKVSENMKDFEKFTVKKNDTESICLNKISTCYKLMNLLLSKNDKKRFLWHTLYEKNIQIAYKKYPENTYFKVLYFSKHYVYGNLFLKSMIPLIQENKNIPEINFTIYYRFLFLVSNLEHLNDKNMDDNSKEYILKTIKSVLNDDDKSQYKNKLLCLQNYWRSLLDEEYLKKTGREKYLTIKVKQSIEEKNKARKLWKEVMKNILNYDPYKNYFDKNVKNIDSEKIKPKKITKIIVTKKKSATDKK